MTEEGIEFFGKWGEVIDFNVLDQALSKVSSEMSRYTLCPSPDAIFRAFTLCDYDKLSIVILGQSPYPQTGIATGLAFGNRAETPEKDWSPSLKVLYNCVQETCQDDLPFGFQNPFPTLEGWAEQGVLLLNSTLTIKQGQPDSHYEIWRGFIRNLIENLVDKKKDVIFVLFGETARTFEPYIPKERCLKCVHPAYCARNNTRLPSIFQEIDKKCLELHKPLIYWI